MKRSMNIQYPRQSSLFIVMTLFFLSLGFTQQTWAQIAPLSDQYLINPFQNNPAIAGTERYMPLRITTRQQWIGIENAPSTQAITVHRRLRASKIRFTPRGFINKGKNSFGKVGIGGSIFNYSYGAVKHTGFSLTYAYHAFLGNGRLAFGLSPVFLQYSLNKSGFILPDGTNTDPLIANDPNESMIFVDANAGMHYYDENGYAGLSIVQLLNSGVQFGNLSYDSEDQMSLNPDLSRTMYAYYGTYLKINRDFMVEPSLWLKYNDQSGFRFDVNAMFNVRELLQAGLSYRFQESAGIIVGVRLDNLQIRYMFEAPFTSKIPNRYTSHQIMINFNLGEPID
jgi:type IX secretion system PorP/SprF family membrane protein